MSLEELQFVNAFIGFCIPSGGTWPAPFVEASYEITGLEHEVDTVVDGVACAPVAEMIRSSSKAQHCILLEAKSGSVSDRQARAYKAVTINQLLVAGVAADEIDVSTAFVDTIYVTGQNNSERLSADFGRAGVEFPLLVHGDSSFRLVEGSILQEAMHRTFLDGIVIDEAAWPMNFVRCDRDSSDGELAALCIRKMVNLLLKRGEVDIERLASTAIDLWDRRGQEDRRRLRRRLASLLADAEANEFRGEIVRDRPHQRWRRASNKRLTPQSIDRLSDLAAQFVQRKQEGRPFNPDQPLLIPYGPDE
jgi:hypothetical protein